MKRVIYFLISITVAMQTFPVFASADALYDEPNDTLFFRQWYYDATKAYAYRNNNITGKGVKVGIIDSGLTKNFKSFHDFEGVDVQTGINVCALIDNNEERLYNTEDSGHHGTNVTSVICAKADNDYGIAGLTDGCTLVPYKMEDFDCSSLGNSGYATIVAIELAYRNDCDVVNISRGSDGDIPQSQIDLQNQIIDKAIQNGMIIVAATGNSGKKGNPIEYPANCDNVIGVGGLEPDCQEEEIDIDLPETCNDINLKYAYPKETIRNLTDNAYSKYSTSTANESVFVSAPGTNITLPCITDRVTQEWTSGSGTSYATPIVAAAAIGAKQMRPYIDVDMFKEILIATSTDLDAEGYDINTGYGMVNFEKIYEYVSQMPLTAPERTPEVTVDYENGKLINFCPNREYTINGVNIGTPEYDDSILGIGKNIGGNIDIPEEWYGTTIEIVKKASSDAYTDSEPQLLEIPAQPEPPTIEVAIDYANERLLGLDNNKEYTVNGETVELETFVYPTTGTGLEIADDWFGNTIEIEIKGTDVSTNVEIPARKSAPIIDVQNDNSVKFSSDILFKEENAATWNRTTAGNIITLKPGKTYVFKIPYTENSFASEIRQITVQFPETQYDIETSIEYDPDTGECTYSAVNNTIWTADVIGIIAVYAQNGVLKHLETVSAIPAEGINKKLNFALTDGDTVKWLVWDSLESMKPKEKVKLSEYNIKLKEATNT